jgi:hypothetical protein
MILNLPHTAKTLAVLTLLVAGAGWCSAQAGRTLYVDCSRSLNGNGSMASPWNDLKAINELTLEPGDSVRLRRGTACHGSLKLHGSGSVGHPIRLTAYGEGPRPRIIAGTSAEESLRLFNQQYWQIDSLDLSGGNTYGIFISGDNGVLHHIYLSNLAVHNVIGGKMKHKESGLVAISPGAANAHFDDVLVDGVDAWNTNQWVGILVGGGDLGFPPESDWNTNAVIRNSTVHDVQGDGIVLFRVRKGLIDSSVAWSIGMQDTQTIGTPNAIWTWMCDDCTVQGSEAYLTDSPGVDGGAFDIDYGNTKNSVLDSYGHDTQGYCIAVFGAGFVTHESLVRGNLCINNGRSPRMANYQGAIFLWTWNGGSIDGLTTENNTVYWSPFENSPALLNKADIKAGSAVFRNNTVYSTAPWMVESNTLLSFAGNNYRYFGSGEPQWEYGAIRFTSLQHLQHDAAQDAGASFTQAPLEAWSHIFEQWNTASRQWKLECSLPISLNQAGLLNDDALRQIVILKSFGQQYRPQGLRVRLQFISPNAKLFDSASFRNALMDLDLNGIDVSHSSAPHAQQMILLTPDGKIAAQWDGPVGTVTLGLALRKALGEPIYAQMDGQAHE